MPVIDPEFPNIVADLGTLGGKARIEGTRISVAFLVELAASGASVDTIVEEYPHLRREDVQEALRYAARLVAEEMIYIAPLVR